jgi:hypothetical protein
VGKHFDDLTAGDPACHIRIMAEAKKPKLPGDGLASQAAIATQIASICRIGAGLETAKDGCHLPVAGTAAGLIRDGQRCIDGY